MSNAENLTVKTKIGEGGRIVIPAKIRQAIGAEIGENVTLSVKNNSLQITTSKEALRRLQALVRKHVPEGVSLVDELIRDRREEAANE
jgi:AbrB family looped-hinge helix DNA binding protein